MTGIFKSMFLKHLNFFYTKKWWDITSEIYSWLYYNGDHLNKYPTKLYDIAHFKPYICKFAILLQTICLY